MYSPKVREDLIPVLYRLAKLRGMPMTMLVDGMLRESLAQYPVQSVQPNPNPEGESHAESLHIVFEESAR